jgi:hypothetical protein
VLVLYLAVGTPQFDETFFGALPVLLAPTTPTATPLVRSSAIRPLISGKVDRCAAVRGRAAPLPRTGRRSSCDGAPALDYSKDILLPVP